MTDAPTHLPVPYDFEELTGIMWCTEHSGVADELNTGDVCDMTDAYTLEPCHLVPVYIQMSKP